MLATSFAASLMGSGRLIIPMGRHMKGNGSRIKLTGGERRSFQKGILMKESSKMTK